MDPGLDRHDWESDWQALESDVADSPTEAVPELVRLVERMLEDSGMLVDGDDAARGVDPELAASSKPRARSPAGSTPVRPSIPAMSGRRLRVCAASSSS
jgi:hypothetical protein